jgi:hypothetical protein
MTKENKEALRKSIVEGEFTLGDVIDVVIEENAYIGVGLISLGDAVYKYIVESKRSVRGGV